MTAEEAMFIMCGGAGSGEESETLGRQYHTNIESIIADTLTVTDESYTGGFMTYSTNNKVVSVKINLYDSGSSYVLPYVRCALSCQPYHNTDTISVTGYIPFNMYGVIENEKFTTNFVNFYP